MTRSAYAAVNAASPSFEPHAHGIRGLVSGLRTPEAGHSGGYHVDQACVCTCRTVTVWEWTGAAVDEGEEAAAWFSKYLDTPVRLVR